MAEISWGPGRKEQFVDYICTDVQRALMDRGALENKWAEWLDQYRAPTTTEVKQFPWVGAPLARDTEILTRSGWRRIDEIRVGEDVMTRRDTDGALEWHPVEGLPQRYADKLYHFKSRSIDLLVTSEHVMVCEAQASGKVSRIPAEKLWGLTGYYLPNHGKWNGRNPELLFGLNAGDVCEFVGWFLAEGWIFRGNNGTPSGVGLGQSKSANPEKCRRLEDLFTRLGFRWTRLTGNEAYNVHKSSVPTALFELLVAQRGAAKKRVPPIMFELSPVLIERLLTGMVLGDGCISERAEADRQHEVSRCYYYTISKGLADDVQVLALLCGLHARVMSRVRVASGGVVGERRIEAKHRSYEVAICWAPRAKYDRSFREIVEYNDVAFCVTVKNHAIYARRNGVACWTGNSNIELPITAMNADPLIARFVTIITTPPNIWTLQPLNERWVDAAKPLQDYMQYLSQRTLNMYDVLYRSIIEFVKLGTTIYKTGWTFERRRTQAYQPDGMVGPSVQLLSKPFVDCVSLVDFIIPPEAYHIQADMQGGALWVGERFWLTQAQFLARATSNEPFLPEYDPEGVEKVKNFVDTARPSGGTVEDKRYKLDNYIPSHLQRIELFEVHARYDCTGDGAVDDVVAIVHLPSRTMLRGVCNPYRHGKRPYTVARYFRGDGFYGIGECEQSEVFQKALTTLTNYQMDNVLAVNSPMLGVKLGANVVPNEPIYPLKIWPLDDPSKDIREVKLADVYPSLPQFSAIIQAWCERRTGMTDIQQGDIQRLPSRTPATSMLSVLQEGNKRFDLSLKELRAALDEVGLRTLQNIQQFLSEPQKNPAGPMQLMMIVQTLGMPEGVAVAQKLTMPLEDIENGLGVNITATSGSQNKELEKQAWLALAQLQAQMGGQYLQLAQIISNPQMQILAPMVVETAAEVFKGTGEIHRRLLEQFDIRNPEDILVNTAVLLDHAAQSAPQTQALFVAGAAAGLLGGGGEGPEQAGGDGGVQGVSEGAGKAVRKPSPSGAGAD